MDNPLVNGNGVALANNVIGGMLGQYEDQESDLSYVATKTERLMFTWPIRNFTERTTPVKTEEYHFMEENQVNMVQWKLQVVPQDVDNKGNEVISAKLYLTYSGADTAGGFKINISFSLKDSVGSELHTNTSSVYYLTREEPPDGTTPCYKATLISRRELLEHKASLLPGDTLTLVAKMVFVQEMSSADQTNEDDFLVPTTSLSRDMRQAFTETDFTDMTIVCDKREFHCHKFMLAARSEVFAAMLRHEFQEKQTSRVDVKEIDSETMELLLSYIYTGHVSDFKNVSVVELFKAADRYRLDHLKQMCEEELVNRVEPTNAADILSLAHKYNAQPLKSFALTMISKNVEEVLRTPGWKELILSDQGLLVEAFDCLARYNMELKNKLDKEPK